MQSLELEGSVRAQGSGERTETKTEALNAVLCSLLFNIWIVSRGVPCSGFRDVGG